MSNITVTEVRRRLRAFAKEHEHDSNEKQHAQQFWRDFYACFGLNKSSAAMFEAKVVKVNGKNGWIDSFIPSLLLVEHKSASKGLDKAYEQAQEYFHALKNEFDKPQYIITCDFRTFHLYDLQTDARTPFVCALNTVADHADRFMFLAEKRVEVITEETPINRKAAYQVSLLHNKLLRNNFTGRDLETFLTRLLFCLFADDTGIFGSDGQFKRLIEHTREDGADTGMVLAQLFQTLNTPHEQRQSNLDDVYKAFEYVNGELFAEHTRIPSFDSELRKLLLEAAVLDWTDISPAIFGAMFQAVLKRRRQLGAHYTSERNILKVIEPLFMDELRAEFERARHNRTRLQALYDKLPALKFFDPACGCGNFLVIVYRELRHLENDVIDQLFFKSNAVGLFDIATLCRVNVGQFYGIEIDEAAAHIARVALYITDHQQNIEAARRFGTTRATVPLVTTPHILYDNALSTDWQTLLPAESCSYVLGNPPFVGKQLQDDNQKNDLTLVAGHIKGYGVLDYVACWYLKTAQYIDGTYVRAALVSTNSITQGEQVAVLWAGLAKYNLTINFAHRTFKWVNEGRANAAVHCVIVGFSQRPAEKCTLFNYANGVDKEPTALVVNQINAYLVEAAWILLGSRRFAVSKSPKIVFGSMANDSGHLLLTEEERQEILNECPAAADWIRPFLGADEFLNSIKRYCIWLPEVSPELLKTLSPIYKRVEKVREYRLRSTRAATQKLAASAALFGEIRQPKTNYLVIPCHSSENRAYIPIGFVDEHVICGNANMLIECDSKYVFGVLMSVMHMAWTRTVCGRIKSDYRYSAGIVYNNFVWASDVTNEQHNAIEQTAQRILVARAAHPNASLAQLYDPLTMPTELAKAHQANDKAVDKAYGYKGADDDASRVAFLFKLYEKATSLLPPAPVKRKRKTKGVA